jgi:uncharacterized protein YbjQ (UPF0145 family)
MRGWGTIERCHESHDDLDDRGLQKAIKYLGRISVDAFVGAHIFRDLMASVVMARAAGRPAVKPSCPKQKEPALGEMREEARRLGANAIGIHMDYETIGAHRTMVMANTSGMAVVVE